MPGGRNIYDPGLPGGGRARYVGPDAYPAQQRENETRALPTPLGYFHAPVWFTQNSPSVAFWFADLNPQTLDMSVPVVAGVDNSELGIKYWSNATLQKFNFTWQGQTFSGWTVVLKPGWWHLDFSCQIVGAVGSTLGGSSAVLIPTRILAAGTLADIDRNQLLGDYQPPYSGTSFLTGGSDNYPVKEESALFLFYETNIVGVNQILASQQGGLRYGGRSRISGFRIA